MMSQTCIALLVTVGFSMVGAAGDYLLKMASEQDDALRSRWFLAGFCVYASTAFGWVFVMKHLKLATIAAVYSVSMILFLTALGVGIFGERLNGGEIVGLLLAVASLILLTRFA